MTISHALQMSISLEPLTANGIYDVGIAVKFLTCALYFVESCKTTVSSPMFILYNFYFSFVLLGESFEPQRMILFTLWIAKKQYQNSRISRERLLGKSSIFVCYTAVQIAQLAHLCFLDIDSQKCVFIYPYLLLIFKNSRVIVMATLNSKARRSFSYDGTVYTKNKLRNKKRQFSEQPNENYQ